MSSLFFYDRRDTERRENAFQRSAFPSFDFGSSSALSDIHPARALRSQGSGILLDAVLCLHACISRNLEGGVTVATMAVPQPGEVTNPTCRGQKGEFSDPSNFNFRGCVAFIELMKRVRTNGCENLHWH